MTCPYCNCNQFRFKLPRGRRQLVGPLYRQVIEMVNQFTDTALKEPDEPCLDLAFTCARCGESFIKHEGELFEVAFSRFQQQNALRP